MANETDQFLFEKLKNGVDGKGLPSQFKGLVEMLGTKIGSGSSQDSSEDSPIRHSLFYLNDILTESQTSSNRYIANWRIGRKLKRIKEEIRKNAKHEPSHSGSPEEATQRSMTNTAQRTMGSTGSSSGASVPSRSSSSDIDPAKIYGLNEEVENLEKSLIPDVFFQAIGIVGIGGIGKTTLCQMIFNSKKVQDDFAPRIWVSVSRRPDEDEDIRAAILKRMLQQLAVEEEDINSEFSAHKLAGLVSLLHQNLWGKKYFIVFDDVRYDDIRRNKPWYEDLETYLSHRKSWDEKLAYALPKGHGGTVIVTGRSEEVVKKMVGPANLHRKLPLQDHENCWKIFRDAAESDLESNLEHKKEIMKQCKLVPSAAKLMGQIVKKIREEQAQSQTQNGSPNP